MDMHGAARNLTCPAGTFAAKVRSGDAPPLCFSPRPANKRPFHHRFSAMMFTCVCFVLVTLLFKVLPRVVLRCFYCS